ncbi:hypothetical protein tb265_32410 [Gemmatimonadetes bacterium T265]|nr:hypothetical protein tb265_32410 [Gemmatimonadetes bacterium T265]
MAGLAAVVASGPAATGRAQAPARGLPVVAAQTDSADAVAFLDTLQTAVARDDRRAVAALVAYPARLWDGRRTQRVRSVGAFLHVYPQVMSNGLRRDVAAATADSLFTNWQGVMFARGRVWFRRTGARSAGPYRVVTINAPVSAPRAAPSRARRPTPAPL